METEQYLRASPHRKVHDKLGWWITLTFEGRDNANTSLALLQNATAKNITDRFFKVSTKLWPNPDKRINRKRKADQYL